MIVFLHGIPETANIWDRVRATIGRESHALRLLGFGCARPPDFGVTKDEYVDWVFAELEKID